MTENQNISRQFDASTEDEINLLDLLIVLARYKKMILGITFVAAVLAAVISLQLPNVYTASAKILPPQQSQASASALLSQLGSLAGMATNSLSIGKSNDLYVSMLQSRTVKEMVAQRFEQQAVPEQESMGKSLMNLLVMGERMNVESAKGGVLIVNVDDYDPKRAADLANAFVEELNNLMQTLSLADASQKRIFLEQQLKQAKDKLTDAEQVLDKTPNTSLKYLDAVRNLKYQEAVWEILAKQFEMSKLDEAKDFLLIKILDKAIPPQGKSKPKRIQIVILVALAAFFMAVIWAFVVDALRRANDRPEQAERLAELRNAIRVTSGPK